MKYYKISEEELKKLLGVLNDDTDEYLEGEFIPDTKVLLITGHYGIDNKAIQFEGLKEGLELQEITDKFNEVDRIIADLTGDVTDKSRLEFLLEELENELEVVLLKPPALDIDKLEGAVWHSCPKTNAHTEFTELKFQGGSMFISGFCRYCEEELVRLSEKKE